jgi:hypothetical protein
MVEPVDFVMEHRMLGWVKARAEHVGVRHGQD